MAQNVRFKQTQEQSSHKKEDAGNGFIIKHKMCFSCMSLDHPPTPINDKWFTSVLSPKSPKVLSAHVRR